MGDVDVCDIADWRLILSFILHLVLFCEKHYNRDCVCDDDKRQQDNVIKDKYIAMFFTKRKPLNYI